MEHIIEKHALDNALKYNGKANPGSVIGAVVKEIPDAKKDMKSLAQRVSKIVSEVNLMNLEEQEARIKEIAPEMLEKEKPKEKDIFGFVEVKGDVVTAFPPEPSKYPHIGHAKSILVNYEFAKRNNGKFILRFEDTNPELAKKEFYDIHLDNYKWLGVELDAVSYASDFMEKYYECAEKLINSEDAYVCSCEQETVKKGRMNGTACEHRKQSPEENLKQWKEMFSSDPGFVLRAKIDLNHKNTVMRDPTLFRIIKANHCRTNNVFTVWPTYDFENAVMDGVQGITHRFRTKEFELRSELQKHLQNLLKLPITFTYEFARFNLEGVESSGRVIREKVESGESLGWDDPGLTTLVALRRRGFQPEAIKNFSLSTGITKSEATLTWEDIIMHNKRLLDEQANRYFFVEDPVKVKIEGAPKQDVELPLHPEHRRGGRNFSTHEEFYISKKDFEELKDGKLYRFMECLNFIKEGNDFKFHSTAYEDYKGKGDKIMHFLPVQDLVEIEVLMPDKKAKKGLAEPLVSDLKIGDVIRFERFGFCRLDEKNKFWYTHS